MRAIAAVDIQRGLAKNGKMPWDRPKDLKWFRGITYGHPVIMGRNTFENLPPLSGRSEYILTNHPDDLPERVQPFEGDVRSDAIVIGGKQTYGYFWDSIHTFFLTVINENFECDLKLPPMDSNLWNREKIYSVDDMKMWRLERTGMR